MAIISRRNSRIYINYKSRGMRAEVPVTKVDEFISLVRHAATFHTEDEAETKKTKRTPVDREERAASRAAEQAAAEKADAKAAKAKVKITFAPLAEDGTTLKPLQYIRGMLEASKKGRLARETVVSALASFGSSKSEKKNALAAEKAVLGLERTKRLTLLDGKLRMGPGPGIKEEAATETVAAKTGTDDD